MTAYDAMDIGPGAFARLCYRELLPLNRNGITNMVTEPDLHPAEALLGDHWQVP